MKTPLFFFNDDFLGLARLKGQHRLHTHDRDELFYVLDGELTITVDRERHTLRAGDAVLIEKGEEHVTTCEDVAHVLIFEPKDIGTEYVE